MLIKGQNEREFDFYISASYDFEERIWRSWWLDIEANRWKDSLTKDYKYPILRDQIIFYENSKLLPHNRSEDQFWSTHSKRLFEKCFNGLICVNKIKYNFRIDLWDSNNPGMFGILSGYYICETETDFDFIPSKVLHNL